MIQAQSYPRDSFEVIVADNASPEGEAAVTAAIAGRARLVTVRDRGAAPARNGGVAAARGKILAFTDCDCQPSPDWLAEGIRALGMGAADFIGGRVDVLVDDPGRMTAAEAFESVFAFDNKSYVQRKGFTVTANLFCSRALFEAVGGFRTGVSEDTEWCHRAIAAGYTIAYAPAAVVGHPARRTWDELIHKWRRINMESYALFKGGRGGRLRWVARACALPASAVAHTPRVLASPCLKSAGQRLATLAVLYRLRLWRMGDALKLAAADRA